MASEWGSASQEMRLHNPNAHEPHDCVECKMDMRHPLPGNNRSCCTAPINAYHDSDCVHARWNGPELPEPILVNPLVAKSRGPYWPMKMHTSEWEGNREIGRRMGMSIHYLMEQQRLLQYYHAEQVHIYDDRTEFHAAPFDRDVDATFENEFKLSNEKEPH